MTEALLMQYIFLNTFSYDTPFNFNGSVYSYIQRIN